MSAVLKQSPVPTLDEEIAAAIKQRAAEATPEDHAKLKRILAVPEGEKAVWVEQMTPGLCALLMLDYNNRNRDFRPIRAGYFAEEMKAGRWRWNGAAVCFYSKPRVLSDGQHRSGASVHAGVTFEAVIAVGLDTEDIATVDCGVARKASDAAQLSGIEQAKEKESVWGQARYYQHVMLHDKRKPSVMELQREIRDHNKRIENAIEIGANSLRGVTRPVLTAREASVVAMLLDEWPRQRLVGHLAAFQCGQFKENELHPMCVAATKIGAYKDKKARVERITPIQLTASVIQAFRLSEQGIQTVRRSEFPVKVKSGDKLPALEWPGQA